jgi:phosphomevalonate kinase
MTIELWSSGVPASTSALLARVRRLGKEAPERHRAALSELTEIATECAEAFESGESRTLIPLLSAQRVSLQRLGNAAGAPIVTPEVQALAAELDSQRGTFMPSGAGGGDMVLYFGLEPSGSSLRERASALGHRLIPLTLGVRGAHRLSSVAP